MTDKLLVCSELDGHTKLFGWKFSPGGSSGLVTIYVEDDESWFPKITFDIYWIKDFKEMSSKLKDVHLP